MAVTVAELEVLFSAQGTHDVTQAVDTVERKLEDSSRAAQAGGAALAGMAAAAAVGFGKAVGVTADFDAQLSAIASVGGRDAQQRLEEIRQTALALGAETAFSASEAAGGMEEMIKAGLSVSDVLGGAARAALDLSAASGTAVEDSATIMSTMLNTFGSAMTGFRTEGEKAIYLADLLAQAANASATDVRGLGYALQASGAIARGFGLDAEQTATALAILAQNGLASSDMGTSLKSMLLSITRDTKPAKEALGQLGLSLEDLTDASGQFIGIEEMFALFRQGAEEAGISGLELNVILNKLFGSDGGRAAQIFFRTTEEGWAGMRAGMANAGTAGEQAAERLNNLHGDIEELTGAVETGIIAFTSFTTGPLRALTQQATRVVRAIVGLPPELQQLILIVGGLATAIGGLVGAWSLFGNQIMLALRGLALLSPPLLLISGLVAGLYLAWQTNFGGIRDITERVFTVVGERLARMKQFFQAAKDRGLTPFRLAMRTLIVTLAERLGRGHPVVEFLQGVLRNGERLTDWLTETGIPAMRRFVRAITEGDFAGAGQIFAGVFEDIRGGWDRTVGPWLEERLGQMRAFPATLLSNILTGAEGVNWPLVGQAIRDGLGRFADWVGDRLGEALGFGAMLLQQVGQGLEGLNYDAIGLAVQRGLETSLAVLGELGGWAMDRVREADWDSVGRTLETLARVAVFGVISGARAEIRLLGQLGRWMLDRLGEVDWAAVATTLTTKGGELAAGLQHGIQDHWNNTLAPWLRGVIAGIPGVLAGAGTWLTTDGAAIITGLLHGLQDAWNNRLSPWLHGVLDGIPGLLAGAGAWLTSDGLALIQGLLRGMQDFWNNHLSPWLHAVLDGVPGLLAAAGTWLTTSGAAIVQGLLHGMQDFWNNHLSGWLHAVLDGLPGLLLTAGTWLVTGGFALIQGLLRGMQDFWNNHLSSWLHAVLDGLPGLFAGAVDWLASGGATVISGLLNGLQDVWNNRLSPWLHGVLDGLPGLLTGAGAWLVEGGRNLIDGLRHGIQDYWNNTLSPWMRGMKQSFLGFFGPDPTTWLSETGRDILDGLRHGIQDYWNNTLAPWMRGMKQSFLDFFKGAGTWLVDVGGNIIGGLKQGVEDGWEGFSGWFGEQIGKLPGVGEEAVEAKSPARAFIPLGQSMIQGIQVGAEAEAPRLQRGMQRLVSGLTDLEWGGTFDRFGERASALMQHFFLVLTEGEYGSEALGRFGGRMREAMLAVGKDMSDGLFRGWETYERQFGTRVVGRLQQAFGRVERLLGRTGTESGERFAGGLERGVRRGTREVEVTEPVFRRLGRNTSRSLADGFEDRSGDLGNAIRSTVERAIDAMKRRLGIASPSRVFRWFGQMSLDGLVGGWRSQEGAFLGAVDSTLRSAVGMLGRYGRQAAGMSWAGPAMGPLAPPAIAAVPRAITPMAPAGGAPGAPGGVTHQTIHVTVNLHELEEMVEAGRFVRDLETSRTLYLGGTA